MVTYMSETPQYRTLFRGIAFLAAILIVSAVVASTSAAARSGSCVVRPSAKCAGANLAKKSLKGARLKGANLRGANLSGADLSKADLRGADLTNARLTGSRLAGARLAGAKLTGAASGGLKGKPATVPTGWQLRSGYFLGPGAALRGMTLQGVDLTGANLEGADLRGARLDRATLNQARLAGALLGPPPSGRAGVVGKQRMVHGTAAARGEMSCGRSCTGASLVGANLVDADMSGADLTSANLNGVNAANALMRGANFTNSTMIGASFIAADLSGANLSNTNVDGADFFRARLESVIAGGVEGTPKVLPDGLSLGGGRIRTVLASPTVRLTPGAGTLAATFTSVPSASSYAAQVCNIAGSDCSAGVAVNSGHVFTGLLGGTTYTVKITAVGDGTVYADSVPGTALGRPDPVTLDAPVFDLARGYGSLTLNFTTDARARSYQAEFCNAAGTECNTPFVVTSGRAFTGLIGGTSYRVRLTAIGDGAAFLNSPIASATAAPLSAPLNAPPFTLTPGDGTLALTFASDPDAVSYRAQLCDAAGNSCGSAATVTSGHVFSGLVGGDTYTVKLTAIGDGVIYGDSSPFVRTGVPALVLASPTFSLVPGPGSLTLSFAADAHAQSYRAQVCNAAGASCGSESSVESGHRFAGLLGGTTYTIKMKAVGDGVAYLDSGLTAVTGTPGLVTLGTPAFSLAPGSGSLTLTFAADPDAAWYSAQVCNSAGLSCGAPVTVTSGHVFSGLTGGTTYTIKLIAGGDGAAYIDSAPGSMTGTPGNPAPVIVPLSAPTFSLTRATGSLTLSFTPDANATGYRARVCNAAGTGCGAPTTVTPGYAFTGLTGGTTYRVDLTAIGDGTAYSDSPSASVTGVPLTQLSPPTYAVASGPTSLSITVNPVPNASGYRAQVCNSAGNGCSAAKALTTTSSLYPGLSPSTSYVVKVTAVGNGTQYADSVATPLTRSTAARTTGAAFASINADLTGRNLSGRNFTGSTIEGGMWNVDFSYADFTNATLRAVIQGANFTGANLVGLRGDHLMLWGVYYPTTPGGGLRLPAGYKLVGDAHQSDYCYPFGCADASDYSSWSAAFLVGPGVNHSGANLSGLNMSAVNLSGANLANANLTGANLTGANLSFATVAGITWANTTCPDGTNSNSHGNTCVGYGA
jgi:uncharacterized protein YjbI with pentapeptide repeats